MIDRRGRGAKKQPKRGATWRWREREFELLKMSLGY